MLTLNTHLYINHALTHLHQENVRMRKSILVWASYMYAYLKYTYIMYAHVYELREKNVRMRKCIFVRVSYMYTRCMYTYIMYPYVYELHYGASYVHELHYGTYVYELHYVYIFPMEKYDGARIHISHGKTKKVRMRTCTLACVSYVYTDCMRTYIIYAYVYEVYLHVYPQVCMRILCIQKNIYVCIRIYKKYLRMHTYMNYTLTYTLKCACARI